MAPVERILPPVFRCENEHERKIRRKRRFRYAKISLAAILLGIPVIFLVLRPIETVLVACFIGFMWFLGFLYTEAFHWILRALDRN